MSQPYSLIVAVHVLLLIPGAGLAQTRAPRGAADLVVAVVTPLPGGSGLIVARDANGFLIVTAEHVLHGLLGGRSDTVRVKFRFDTTPVVATVEQRDSDMDIAVLRVSQSAGHHIGPQLHRLAASDPKWGDEITALGCGWNQTSCWAPPPFWGRVARLTATLAFEQDAVSPGNSGGPLFNADWEVVGLVQGAANPYAKGLRIDSVLGRIRRWSPFRDVIDLKRPWAPRGGYRTRVSFAVSVPWSRQLAWPASRFPGGHVHFIRRFGHVRLDPGRRAAASWRVGFIRLEPRNMNINGATAGLGLSVPFGVFAIEPFVEGAIARVEARFDSGGYVVQGVPGPRYVPWWRQARLDGVGYGGGLTLSMIIMPHVALEGTFTLWNQSLPSVVTDKVPTFIALGLQVGR